MVRRSCADGAATAKSLDAKFAKGAKFRKGRTGNGKDLNAEGAEERQKQVFGVWAELGCGEDAGEDLVDVGELAVVVEGGGELLRR